MKLLYNLANDGAIGVCEVNFGFNPSPLPYFIRIVIEDIASICLFEGEYLSGKITFLNKHDNDTNTIMT